MTAREAPRPLPGWYWGSSGRCAAVAGACAMATHERGRLSPSGWAFPRSSDGCWRSVALTSTTRRASWRRACAISGTTAHLPLADADEAGLEVIVIDHHVAEPLLPRAVAVVNPNRLDETSTHGALAAVGIAFLLIVAVNRELRRAGWYVAGRPEPDL